MFILTILPICIVGNIGTFSTIIRTQNLQKNNNKLPNYFVQKHPRGHHYNPLSMYDVNITI